MPQIIPDTMDANDELIVPGAKVVYNKSGELAFGEIEFVQIKKGWQPERFRRNPWVSYIQVRQVKVGKDGTATRTQETSKVKNPRCVMVIEQFPGCTEAGPPLRPAKTVAG